jgi:farnesyl diphosphate synthase
VLAKATWPSLFGLDEAKKRCNELLTEALEALDDVGRDAGTLRWLARFIVERAQ